MTLRSANPDNDPLIYPNYLVAERDQCVVVAILRKVREILATPPLAKFMVNEVAPGARYQTDAELLEYVHAD